HLPSLPPAPSSPLLLLLSLLLPPPPPRSTLFPYTTLFRSLDDAARSAAWPAAGRAELRPAASRQLSTGLATILQRQRAGIDRLRSEEHTSELQSRENLVCRLLLEKKKKTQEIERSCK